MDNLWQFYLLIAIILIQGIFAFGNKNNKPIFILLCFLELTFIAGFRSWNIGNDTLPYVGTFIETINNWNFLHTHMEKGYIFYNKLVSFFTLNPQGILVANALVITGSILLFIKRYSVSLLFSVLFFVILQFDSTMNIMRQYISVSIILFSMPFIIKRRLIHYIICCVIATTFHTSAILALPLYWLYNLRFKMQYLMIILLVTVVSFTMLAPIIDKIIYFTGRYESYKGNILLGEDVKVASIVKSFVQFIITVFCYFSYRYVYSADKLKSPVRVQFLLWCSIVALCLQLISIRATVMERLVLYYSIFNIISIAFFVSCYPKKNRFLVSSAVLACFIVYHSIIFIYRPEWNHVLPFEFCFG